MFKTKQIKELILDYFKGSSLSEINEIITIEKTWKNIVGKNISKNTEVVYYKKGVLTIKTSNPIWRNELSLQKKELIDKVNETEQKLNLTEIIFR